MDFFYLPQNNALKNVLTGILAILQQKHANNAHMTASHAITAKIALHAVRSKTLDN